jgi:septal ring factor EnvC (AmiA/AmiB activator)
MKQIDSLIEVLADLRIQNSNQEAEQVRLLEDMTANEMKIQEASEKLSEQNYERIEAERRLNETKSELNILNDQCDD